MHHQLASVVLFERRVWPAKSRQNRLATVVLLGLRTGEERGRFLILNLGAVWCHLCHVMDEINVGGFQTFGIVFSW